MNKLSVVISGISCIILATSWYLGLTVPAWVALIWCVTTFVADLEKVFK